ncbi:H-NS histone family protein [Paraburkholderia sp. BL10I2N1]|uniref:H-NS histone family protein n=1 Tax=Paraburkholderia sp. BL10I2N1 TaxID=1938796 RepID=UPI00105EAA1A|nr:H-NS histone family protein [Paraburkholderia sp. BL10I2N1]TDN68864.1 DNA-binding protein H-NS [Paraburkholderia sp. BL10I2N1]
MDERKRDSMVAYLRRRMQEFGIKPADLASAIASDQSTLAGPRYRSATGDTWNGEGKMPQWLQQAISAGQSAEHFKVSSNGKHLRKTREKVDWRDDPFAGSPLARVQREPSTEAFATRYLLSTRHGLRHK